jgi:mannose-6-phosphate isomerase-like protein (cupin superfamily)
MKTVGKLWGFEIWFENNDLYCGKKIFCRDEIWSSEGDYHYHPIKDETFYVIEGKLELDVEGTVNILSEGEAMRIKPGTKHRFRSHRDRCVFIEVSTTHCDTDSIRCKLEE